MDNNFDKLIQYTTILSNYEHGNYRLNDEEANILKTMNKSNDLKIQIEVDKIKKMSFSERDKYIESLKEKMENKKEMASSVEEEISITFGVDVSHIKVNTLKNGKTLYTFYDEKLGRNVVLQSNDKGELTKNLQEIRKESSEEASLESEDILEEKRVKDGLEVEFIYLSDIGRHLSEISSFPEEKRRELKFLIDNALEFGIVAINLENVIGIDSYGNVFEVYFDKVQNRNMINNVDNGKTSEETKNKEDEKSDFEKEIKNNQLKEMLSESSKKDEEAQNNLLDQNSQELEKSTIGRVLQRQIPQYGNIINNNVNDSIGDKQS